MYGNELVEGGKADFLAFSTMGRLQSRNNQYCTTYEATAPVNSDRSLQLNCLAGDEVSARCRRIGRSVLSGHDKANGFSFGSPRSVIGFSIFRESIDGGMIVAFLPNQKIESNTQAETTLDLKRRRTP